MSLTSSAIDSLYSQIPQGFLNKSRVFNAVLQAFLSRNFDIPTISKCLHILKSLCIDSRSCRALLCRHLFFVSKLMEVILRNQEIHPFEGPEVEETQEMALQLLRILSRDDLVGIDVQRRIMKHPKVLLCSLRSMKPRLVLNTLRLIEALASSQENLYRFSRLDSVDFSGTFATIIKMALNSLWRQSVDTVDPHDLLYAVLLTTSAFCCHDLLRERLSWEFLSREHSSLRQLNNIYLPLFILQRNYAHNEVDIKRCALYILAKTAQNAHVGGFLYSRGAVSLLIQLSLHHPYAGYAKCALDIIAAHNVRRYMER